MKFKKQDKLAVEIVNYQLDFKVNIRQNQTHHFCSANTEQERENPASTDAKDYPKMLQGINICK